jgi:phosphatidylserine/phosphatidylglycerophosphate/cardiolipin synthase-like enzyme
MLLRHAPELERRRAVPLHAAVKRILVIDDAVSLVTSANFTERG